jgi:hypothetical protein
MTYVKVDDKMPEHPKIVPLSDGAFRLYVSAIAYAGRNLTDGILRAEAVPGLMPRYRKAYLNELVQRALWLEVIPGEVYEIHDYLQWNSSRAVVEKQKQARAAGGKKGADRRWHEQ